MKRQQGGFTLIELIMVIVILGILAAFALPKFADLSGDARYSTIAGALGSVRSASAIVHSAALAGNKTGATDSVTLEGTSIALVHGYIAGTVDDITAAAQLSKEFTVSAASGVVTVALGSDCKFTYTQATSATSGVLIGDISSTNTNTCAP